VIGKDCADVFFSRRADCRRVGERASPPESIAQGIARGITQSANVDWNHHFEKSDARPAAQLLIDNVRSFAKALAKS
jgi:hypothetical protein